MCREGHNVNDVSIYGLSELLADPPARQIPLMLK